MDSITTTSIAAASPPALLAVSVVQLAARDGMNHQDFALLARDFPDAFTSGHIKWLRAGLGLRCTRANSGSWRAASGRLEIQINRGTVR
jgi:hypothetical protein